MHHSCLKFSPTHTVRAFHLIANDIAQKLFLIPEPPYFDCSGNKQEWPKSDKIVKISFLEAGMF